MCQTRQLRRLRDVAMNAIGCSTLENMRLVALRTIVVVARKCHPRSGTRLIVMAWQAEVGCLRPGPMNLMTCRALRMARGMRLTHLRGRVAVTSRTVRTPTAPDSVLSMRVVTEATRVDVAVRYLGRDDMTALQRVFRIVRRQCLAAMTLGTTCGRDGTSTRWCGFEFMARKACHLNHAALVHRQLRVT